MTARDQVELSDDPAVLRAEVVRLREELERARLTSEPERDLDSVTDELSLQQQVDTLRQSLREKDRVVDVTAAQCRRLEDELEDQRLANDAIKQDLDRKKHLLAVTREQATRSGRERQEIEGRYLALVDADAPASKVAKGTAGLPLDRLPAASPARQSRTFLAGLVAGVLIAGVLIGGVAALLVGVDSLPFSAALQIGTEVQDPPVPAVDHIVPDEVAAAEVDPHAVADTGDKDPPEAAQTVRDYLRDGTPGPLMAVMRPARFTMGKLRALPGDDRAPAHPVDLGGFLFGTTEVTFEEYDRFARAVGVRSPNDFGWGRGRRPAVDVTWDDALAYTRWLSEETGRRYRLPSEAEWEFAAAAGRRSTFWWGYQPGDGRAVCFDCGTRWDNRSTAPVGTFDPNPLGLYDTAGNALEWVADCYRSSYSGAPADGTPRTWDQCRYRVARGGAFNKPARSMGSRVRHRFDPATRLNMLGFRLARDE